MRTGILYAALAVAAAAKKPDVTDFDWSTLEPSSSLNYTTCYHDHKCAKLTLPLDWLDDTNPNRVTLAVIARPASVPHDDPAFGGTIITNPGGPSGSGVSFILRAGETIQFQADRGRKKYEILSFDPRGVGLSEPRSDCFHDEFVRSGYALEQGAIGYLDGNLANIRQQKSRDQAFGQLCQNAEVDWDEIRGYMSTSSVARDMVEIVDKLHELRGVHIVTGMNEEEEEEEDKDVRLELRSASKPDKTPRILYWGFSYGTILGRYFISMFPGRVGRVILEGVADVYDYAKAEWAINLPDVQQCLQHFWDTCHEAGDRCALHKSSDKGPDDVRDRVRDFMDRLDDAPGFHIEGSDIALIHKQSVQETIFQPLYSPQEKFPQLAKTLAEAMEGNYTSLYQVLQRPTPDLSCPLSIPDRYSYTWETDGQVAIACGDGDPQGWMQPEDMAEHVANQTRVSPDFGEGWSKHRLKCAGWKIRPRYNFNGPFTTPDVVASPPVKGKPAAGVLFASSRYDPVTPLRNARWAAAEHPGSVVLLQENVGHGSIYSPGKCREEFIANYLETGKLPEDEGEVVCKPDCVPFQECSDLKVTATDAEGDTQGRRLPLHI